MARHSFNYKSICANRLMRFTKLKQLHVHVFSDVNSYKVKSLIKLERELKNEWLQVIFANCVSVRFLCNASEKVNIDISYTKRLSSECEQVK